jgi:hypothetical protein
MVVLFIILVCLYVAIDHVEGKVTAIHHDILEDVGVFTSTG